MTVSEAEAFESMTILNAVHVCAAAPLLPVLLRVSGYVR